MESAQDWNWSKAESEIYTIIAQQLKAVSWKTYVLSTTWGSTTTFPELQVGVLEMDAFNCNIVSGDLQLMNVRSPGRILTKSKSKIKSKKILFIVGTLSNK